MSRKSWRDMIEDIADEERYLLGILFALGVTLLLAPVIALFAVTVALIASHDTIAAMLFVALIGAAILGLVRHLATKDTP